MTLLEKAEREPTTTKAITALIVATLGTIGIVAYAFSAFESWAGWIWPCCSSS